MSSKLSLDAVAREQLAKAATGSAGRSATTVYGGHESVLRQTVVALTAGSELAEHDSPGDATLHVLSGRVTLKGVDTEWEGREGDLLAIPPERHSLTALTHAAVLLTVAKTL